MMFSMYSSILSQFPNPQERKIGKKGKKRIIKIKKKKLVVEMEWQEAGQKQTYKLNTQNLPK